MTMPRNGGAGRARVVGGSVAALRWAAMSVGRATPIAYTAVRMARKNPAKSNPFVYARALAPAEAIERTDEVRMLLEAAVGGHAMTVYAARRMGKTSLLKQLRAAAERQKMPSVLVDLSDVLSVADVAARLEQAYRALPGRLARVVGRELGGLGLTTPLGGLTFQRQGQASDPIATVHALLEVPARIAERTAQRVLVIFDEFQALIDLQGLDGVFRSHLQHQAQVSYVFCGSEPSLLRALFEDRSRPLYGQAQQLRLGRIAFEAAHDFVATRFSQTGKDSGAATPELVNLSELHPQRLMLLAHFLWEQVHEEPATISDLRLAYDSAMRAVDLELRYLWDGLSTNERRVLASVASGLSPYQAEARAMAGLASSSSAQRASNALLDRAILERDEREDLRILDPLLARWVRRHGGARLSVYVVPGPAGAFVVTDGPSLAFTRSEHPSLEEAQAEADRIAAGGRGADVMIYDTEDPNDLPEWALDDA